MADRRMLWKNVCQSKKVNSLSMAAALLWTWSIPWFDRDGYMEVEPDFIKYNIVPRRRDIDESSIPGLVEEIARSGLWDLFYDEERRIVAKEKAFKERQRFEYNKEVESKWANSKWEKVVLSPIPRRASDESSPSGRDEGKVVEGKVVEGKVDKKAENPKPPLFPITQDQKKELATLCAQVSLKFHDQFNPWMWIQKNISLNPLTHLHVMKAMATNSDIKDPWPYANQIALIEDGNYNAQEFQAKSEKDKSIYDEILTDIKKLHGKKEKQDLEK